MITKEGLRYSLQSMMEFGYKAHERGDNLLAAQMGADGLIETLVKAADNCPAELMRITIKPSGKRPEVNWKPKKGKR